MIKSQQVAIVGGGFSGTLLAINLLRANGPRAILIERRATQLARGVAYGTRHDGHILNVRASNMSAFPDQPDHFRQWLATHGEAEDTNFVSRRLYGAYLVELLASAQAAAPDRLLLVHDEATDIAETVDGCTVMLSSGNNIHADTVVLAQGNLPPHALPQTTTIAKDGDIYHADPWRVNHARDISSRDAVLLIGTGLTAVDVALTLTDQGFEGRIIAMSRRGLLPRAHQSTGPNVERGDRPPSTGSQLVAYVRARSRAIGWRAAIDELRPHTQNIWASANPAERARYLRHLRPYWDVHRHRLAPQVAEQISAMEASGALIVLAGKITGVAPGRGGVGVTWRPRGEATKRLLNVARVINCTGPQGDVLTTHDPLLRQLVDRDIVRPDLLRLGIDVTAQGRVVGRSGTASARLFAIGPMTRGAFWEVVAVPDLRQQAWDLARWLSGAHWIGGEGL